MPVFNADEAFEPITVVLNEKTYTVVKMTQQLLDDWSKQGDGEDKDDRDLNKSLGQMFGVAPSEFSDTDLCKLAAVARWVTETLQAELSGKTNPTEEEAQNSPS